MPADYALVVTCEKLADNEAESRARLWNRLRGLLPTDGVSRIELFSPHPDYEDVPFFKDGSPPAALVEFVADSPETLKRLAVSAGFAACFAGASSGVTWSAGYFRIVRQPVGADLQARPREAQTSFVVRYYPPVEDAARFAAHYVANHPPILARLPEIRNVLCYVPLDGAVPGCTRDQTVIRNEVVFGSVASLVDSLRSPVLAELRADTRTFPPFGHSTHHAMVRTPLA
ncbi:MAG: hypothetical protein EPO23_13210 [Xanthobacteraceae bacterium]|nr:MAG: hypothetical protein EPO23_13210 [Xanthobacteraceae bacterium]